MKKCSRCGEEKDESEFHKHSANKDGLYRHCKSCAKEQDAKRPKVYNVLVKSKCCVKCKEIKIASHFSKKAISKDGLEGQCKACRAIYHKDYAEKNKDKVDSNKRKWRKSNPERANATSSKWHWSKVKNKKYIDELPVTDEPVMEGKFLTVICKSCGRRFFPTNSIVQHRLRSFKGLDNGEFNFYCSDTCKDTCIVYRFNPRQGADPRSDLAVLKSEQQRARDCQTDHLKQLQLDEAGYNYCENCGNPTELVHLHHTQMISKEGMVAVSSAGHLLMCKECHIELHKNC